MVPTRYSRTLRAICCCAGLLLLFGTVYGQQQIADPDFNATVPKPAYEHDDPVVAIDEAHLNFHTARERYKPFADLLRSDGYTVVSGTKKFDKAALEGVAVLVVANAGSANASDTSEPAFTEQECDVVRDWVRDGGSLLLIADHAPFGLAAERLGQRFGVTMGRGWVFDRDDTKDSITTQLVFSRENSLLGDHPLLRGRDASEHVKRVRSFSGQSLSVPNGASVLLKLSPTAREAPSRTALEAAANAAGQNKQASKDTNTESKAAGDRAQGIAMTFGKGRVVMLGEAGMLTAQVVKFPEGGAQRELKFGMNVPGYDNRQFALNLMHWLSGLLE